MTCLWNITVDPDYVIKVKVVYNRLTMDCSSEYARFIDGTTMDSPTMVTLCHSNQPDDPRYSTGNNILIELKTSSVKDRGAGFLVTYTAVRKAPLPYSCQKNNMVRVVNSTVRLASFNYPLSYPNNAFCRWYVAAPFSKRALLTITKVDLQNSSNCGADYISVKGSDYHSTQRLGLVCGKPKTPIVLTSSGRLLTVDFKSDWLGRYPGFEGIFGTINDGKVYEYK
jgi:hypothetical protein